jgi:hypothetical protein
MSTTKLNPISIICALSLIAAIACSPDHDNDRSTTDQQTDSQETYAISQSARCPLGWVAKYEESICSLDPLTGSSSGNASIAFFPCTQVEFGAQYDCKCSNRTSSAPKCSFPDRELVQPKGCHQFSLKIQTLTLPKSEATEICKDEASLQKHCAAFCESEVSRKITGKQTVPHLCCTQNKSNSIPAPQPTSSQKLKR